VNNRRLERFIINTGDVRRPDVQIKKLKRFGFILLELAIEVDTRPNFVASAAKLSYGCAYWFSFASTAEPTEFPMTSPETTNSTRRFCCRPAGVSFVATGWLLPNPREAMEVRAIPS
jgi:hypothetical protein